MASLAIAALPVHMAAAILLAATTKSPTKAATTEVWEDDLLRLPRIDVFSLSSIARTYQAWVRGTSSKDSRTRALLCAGLVLLMSESLGLG